MKETCVLLFYTLLLGGTLCSQQTLPYNWRPEQPRYGGFVRADTTVNSKRVATVTGVCLAGYGLAYTGISLAWYKNIPKTKWHWFNDNYQWSQVDKMGHAFGGYQGARGMIGLFKWSGMNKFHSALYGGLIGFISLGPIEVLDGFTEKWGASVGDLIANLTGAGLAFTNEMLWAEQRIQFKFSYHPTRYADVYPELFGVGIEKPLKDYNGQTTWLSFRIHSWLPKGGMLRHKYPKWLNIAVGYGANGLEGGYDLGFTSAVKEREYRQFYLSPDIDLSAISTRHGGLRILLSVLNLIHLPAPALELNGQNGFRWHWLYM